jgi:hypothetical protein
MAVDVDAGAHVLPHAVCLEELQSRAGRALAKHEQAWLERVQRLVSTRVKLQFL